MQMSKLLYSPALARQHTQIIPNHTMKRTRRHIGCTGWLSHVNLHKCWSARMTCTGGMPSHGVTLWGYLLAWKDLGFHDAAPVVFWYSPIDFPMIHFHSSSNWIIHLSHPLMGFIQLFSWDFPWGILHQKPAAAYWGKPIPSSLPGHGGEFRPIAEVPQACGGLAEVRNVRTGGPTRWKERGTISVIDVILMSYWCNIDQYRSIYCK